MNKPVDYASLAAAATGTSNATDATAEAMQSDSDDLLQALLNKEAGEPQKTPIFGVVIGKVLALQANGTVAIDIPDLHHAASSAKLACAPQCIVPGALVAVMFTNGDRRQPLVMGVMYLGETPAHETYEEPKQEVAVQVGDQSILIESEQQLELRCGKASIILMADGTILQRGTYISSRASATQRILGGSVQIN